MTKRGAIAVAGVALAWTAAAALPVLAVDGVIDINQARAIAGGVTPGDDPGYPVSISRSGSYRLTGNLGTSSADATIIEITDDDVTLDLNGFAISCSSRVSPFVCNGSGDGVRSSSNNTQVRNGVVRGMGSDGVTLGGFGVVEGVRSMHNHSFGISAGAGSIIRNSTAIENAGVGINVGGDASIQNCVSRGNGNVGIQGNTGTTMTANTSAENGAAGIYCNGGCTISGNTIFTNASGITMLSGNTVIGNTVRNNTGLGLNVSGNDTLYSQNNFTGNNGGGNAAQVSGGTSIGGNFCGTDTVCP